jgi:protein-S-isoprenylcysteine O-methyltransferase Ste14
VTALDFFARWRVRLGYPLGILVLWLAHPTPLSLLIGGALGLLGLAIRAYAAGYLRKQQVLTVTGPYARTRNPLYFGSSFLALGAGIATNSLWATGLLLAYFALVYTFVMKREALELHQQHGDAFADYAATVPLFFPKLSTLSRPSAGTAGFAWSQYKKNHEYEAAIGFALLLIVLILICYLRHQ